MQLELAQLQGGHWQKRSARFRVIDGSRDLMPLFRRGDGVACILKLKPSALAGAQLLLVLPVA